MILPKYCCTTLIQSNKKRKRPRFRFNFLFSLGIDGNLLAVLADPFKPYDAVGKSEERIVLAHANVVARLEFGAALSYEDIARKHELSVRALYAEAFCVTVSAVVG